MRVNIYGEELTTRVEIVKKAVNQELFVGVRFYLKSHPDLHHSVDDNDESAVTFWCPWKKAKGNDYRVLEELFRDATGLLRAMRSL